MAALLSGLTLGFTAGVNPGPLMSLVISTTLARGFAAGARVASAPLVTDIFIVPICVLIVGSLPIWFEPVMAMVGGLFVLWLALRLAREARHAAFVHVAEVPPQRARVDMQRGMLVNVLSPHPWLFWIAVGAPMLVGYWRTSAWQAVAFVVTFYTMLVGAKVAMAAAIAGAMAGARNGGGWLTESRYRALLLASAALLGLFGLLLFLEGVRTAL
jgi:threonine/homoserine/homoserine lactone efflux protein